MFLLSDMKNKAYYLIGFLILLVLGGYVFIQHEIKKEHEQMTALCLNTKDEHIIFECNYVHSISHQTKYDMFYKNQQFFDQTFVFYFKNAEIECLDYPNECVVKDLSVSDNVARKCAKNGNIACIMMIGLGNSNEDISSFDKAISNNYQVSNINGHQYGNFPCDGKLYQYFKSLSIEQQNQLSEKTFTICKSEDDYYKQHPDRLKIQ